MTGRVSGMCKRDDVKEALLRGLGVRFHVDEDVRRKFESIHIGVSVLRLSLIHI